MSAGRPESRATETGADTTAAEHPPVVDPVADFIAARDLLLNEERKPRTWISLSRRTRRGEPQKENDHE